jgi:hypothetical protein
LLETELKVEALGLEGASLEARVPDDGQAQPGKPARLMIRNQAPKAGIEVSFRSAPARVVVQPFLEAADGKSKKDWTREELKKIQGDLGRNLRGTQNEIAKSTARILALEREMAALKREGFSTVIKARMNQVEAEWNAAKSSLQTRQALLPVLQVQSQALVEINDLTGRVHQKGQVAFRVFFTAGDYEVTVLTAR